jgi:multidrug efflux pump subunit AcrB
VFTPNRAELAAHSVGIEQIGLWLRMYNSGFPLDSVRFSKDSEDVTLRVSQGLEKPENLSSISIPTQIGNLPLTSLGNFKLETNPTKITRTDGKRTITVSAGVAAGYSTADANKKLANFVKNDLRLPSGYSSQTGGVNEENQKSVNSILQAMVLAAILISATMIIQFRSYRKALLVMLVIPLAISGVFILFAATGTPLSFPGLIGMLALFGIVVNNAMMLQDKIGVSLKAGLPFKDAIVDAGRARLEPIFLGSFTTIIGLVPITLSDPLWRGLGGAIIAGLTFSGVIMLLFIPVVYYSWFKGEEDKKPQAAKAHL